MRWRTGSQCNCSRSGQDGDGRGACRTIRAAVFLTLLYLLNAAG